jgi:hypothetical protein
MAERAGSVEVRRRHQYATRGCEERPEKYGPNEDGEVLYRCRACNVEWWEDV